MNSVRAAVLGAVLAAVVGTGTAQAQNASPTRNQVRDLRRDHRDVVRDKHEIRSDTRDLAADRRDFGLGAPDKLDGELVSYCKQPVSINPPII